MCVGSALFFFPLSYFNPYPIIQMPRGGKIFTLSLIMRTRPKALEAVRVGMSIRQTSIEFEIPRSTLADRVSGRYSIETKPGISLCIMGFPIDSIPTKGQFQVHLSSHEQWYVRQIELNSLDMMGTLDADKKILYNVTYKAYSAQFPMPTTIRDTSLPVFSTLPHHTPINARVSFPGK